MEDNLSVERRLKRISDASARSRRGMLMNFRRKSLIFTVKTLRKERLDDRFMCNAFLLLLLSLLFGTITSNYWWQSGEREREKERNFSSSSSFFYLYFGEGGSMKILVTCIACLIIKWARLFSFLFLIRYKKIYIHLSFFFFFSCLCSSSSISLFFLLLIDMTFTTTKTDIKSNKQGQRWEVFSISSTLDIKIANIYIFISIS